MTSHNLEISSSLGTLLNVLQFLGVICIWSLSSFLMKFFPPTARTAEWCLNIEELVWLYLTFLIRMPMLDSCNTIHVGFLLIWAMVLVWWEVGAQWILKNLIVESMVKTVALVGLFEWRHTEEQCCSKWQSCDFCSIVVLRFLIYDRNAKQHLVFVVGHFYLYTDPFSF